MDTELHSVPLKTHRKYFIMFLVTSLISPLIIHSARVPNFPCRNKMSRQAKVMPYHTNKSNVCSLPAPRTVRLNICFNIMRVICRKAVKNEMMVTYHFCIKFHDSNSRRLMRKTFYCNTQRLPTFMNTYLDDKMNGRVDDTHRRTRTTLQSKLAHLLRGQFSHFDSKL